MGGAPVRVLPDVPAVDRPFDYDQGDGPPLQIGDRVRVPLHGRSVRGWVIGEAGAGATAAPRKPVSRRLGLGPTAEVVELTGWAAWRWAGARCKLLSSASPERIVEPDDLVAAPGHDDVAEADLDASASLLGRRLARHGAEVLHRLGPCEDPLALVLGVLHGLAHEGRRGSLLVLTPTVGWAERLAARLRHRGLSVADPGAWAEARAGSRVVVGARAAALAPVPTLAGAVILDAHDGAYRQTQAPCWHAVDVLVERCRRAGAPLLATTWCPSPVLRATVPTEEASEHESRGWPRVLVADLATADPRERALSSAFVAAAHRALDEPGDGHKVVVVLQRLGGVRLLACKGCGALAVCAAHAAALFEGDDGLSCARGCAALPSLCQDCGGALRSVREGVGALTKRVADVLATEATEVTAKGGDPPRSARVLVGTEAVLHRARRARLVCFADLDDYLHAPRAHASLDALRAIGLAGRLVGARGETAPGNVLVQTRDPDHPVVAAAVHGRPEAVIEAESRLARELVLPPQVALCSLTGPDAPALAAQLVALGVQRLEVREGRDGAMLVVAPEHRVLCDALDAVRHRDLAVRIEVDPPER